VALRASDSIWQWLLPLFGSRQVSAGKADLEIEIKTDALGHGTMLVHGLNELDNVEPHVLLGGFYQTIVEHLHPSQNWAAFIHAGAVAKNGKAVILAAPSGSGKSTLTALLVAHGYDYLSDDLVPLTFGSHHVTPFPLPISVKAGAVGALQPHFTSLNSHVATTQYLPSHNDFLSPALPAVALVFPCYQAGSITKFETLSPTEAMTRLFEDRIHFGYPVSPENIADFADWIAKVPCRSLIYCDFQEAEACLNSLLSV
jgi:hypothetical protein